MFDPVRDYQTTILNKSALPKNKKAVVLDLGCGRGDNSIELALRYSKVIGVDLEGNFEVPKSIKNLKLIKANAEKLPFKRNTFDIIFAKDTLHHIHNLGLTLSEVKRVLKPGGRLIVVESNRYNPIFYFHMTRMEKHNHFSAGYLKLLLEEHGFTIKKFNHVDSRVYPIPNMAIHNLFHFLETLVENLPLVNQFSSYNVVHVINRHKK
jgi:ubiquinone/menaquinone biosynthesis C-methylase UbiE